jgi:hypothetical protein
LFFAKFWEKNRMKNKFANTILFLSLLLSVSLTSPIDGQEEIPNGTRQIENVCQRVFPNTDGPDILESGDESRELTNGFYPVLSGLFYDQSQGLGFPIFRRESTPGSQTVFTGRFSRSPPFSIFS